MKLLLHSCCGPCSTYPIKVLKQEGIELTSMWFNTNIHPYTEYKNRYESYKLLMEKENISTIEIDEYDIISFTRSVYGHENQRCRYCYESRMEVVAKTAKERGFDAFTTSLLVSPYQKHELLKDVCEKMAEKHGIKFYYRDFREGFREGQQMAREMGLYMQKYCGCIYSEAESFLSPTNNKPKLPEGFEFLPVKRSVVVRKEKDNKEKYIDLLLEANPSREILQKHLKDGEVFVLTYKDETACVAVVTKTDNETVELKDIVTKEEFRDQGYGRKMLKYLADNYKQRYSKMVVGTTENNIPFYVKQGFDKYEKTVKNYFTDNYDEEITDGDLRCIDMYYSKDLKKAMKYNK